MSSRLGPRRVGSQGHGHRVGAQGAVDGVGESAFELAEGFGLGVAGGAAAAEVGGSVGVPAELGDGDAVDGGVELPVAGSGESVSFVAGPYRQRGGSVVPGEGVLGSEPADVCRTSVAVLNAAVEDVLSGAAGPAAIGGELSGGVQQGHDVTPKLSAVPDEERSPCR